MATVIPGAHLSDISGSIGNLTFSTCRFEQFRNTILRPRHSIRKNRQTPEQIRLRRLMAKHAKRWRALTQAQRDLWEHSAWRRKKKIGTTPWGGQGVPMGGYSYFIQTNIILEYALYPPTDIPPDWLELYLGITGLTVTWDPVTKTIHIEWDCDPLSTASVVIMIESKSNRVWHQWSTVTPAVIKQADIYSATRSAAVDTPIKDMPGEYTISVKIVSPQGNIETSKEAAKVTVP